MAGLTSIADRLTPSTPIEQTFGAQLITPGAKVTTLIGHRVAGGPGADYVARDVINIGDSKAAVAEVEAYAGAGSQISLMVKAFIDANAIAGRSAFPPFRTVTLPPTESGFGPAGEALAAIRGLRSDMIVSCYPLSDVANLTALSNFRAVISSPDANLTGQFGSFITVASISEKTAMLQELAVVNSRGVIAACLPDTNVGTSTVTGDLDSGSNTITNVSSTAGISPGAKLSGSGVPAGATVVSVTATTITIGGAAPSADHSAVSLTVVDQPAQTAEIVAAAHAATMMSMGFPYRPFQGMEIGGLAQPVKSSDLIYADPNGFSELCLKAGGSPIRVLPGKKLGMLRARVAYTKLPDGVTEANAYIDWIDLMKLQDYREDMYQVCQNPPFNNLPGGALLTKDLADKLNDEGIRVYYEFQKAGAFQGASNLTKLNIVQASTTNRGTLEFRFPVNAVPGCYVQKGNIVGVTDFDFTV